MKIYKDILEPFFVQYSSPVIWGGGVKKQTDTSLSKMHSLEYVRNGLFLMLIGTDQVVRAYNDVMQNFYHHRISTPDSSYKDLLDGLNLFGNLLREIRKSMGNETTSLDAWDMLEWFAKDARQFREMHAGRQSIRNRRLRGTLRVG